MHRRLQALSYLQKSVQTKSLRLIDTDCITMASFDLMMDLVNFVEMILAVSGSISQMHEKAKRSTPPRSEQRFEESRRGSMSIRRSVKYTVVHLEKYRFQSTFT